MQKQILQKSGLGICLWPSLCLCGSAPGKQQHQDTKAEQSYPRIEIDVDAKRASVDLLIAKQPKQHQDHSKQAKHPSYRITNIQSHRASPVYLKMMFSTRPRTRMTPPR